MTVHTLTFNPFQENTYILSDASGECLIIDPGCYGKEEEKQLSAFIASKGLKPVRLLNTHAHLDHMLGNAFVHRTWNLLPELHALDEELLRAAPLYGEVWGIRAEASPEPGRFLSEGDQVRFGETCLDVLFVPGHCPGHIAFYDSASATLIGGDVLFQGSIGRTDLPGGNLDTLLESIRTKFFTLPDETVVYPGHG
ncbi:MAG: MBL fold metallo-hydrolase, partial [Bacteroidota bacterium]